MIQFYLLSASLQSVVDNHGASNSQNRVDQIDKKEASRSSDAFLSAKIAFLAVLCIALCIFVGNTVNRYGGQLPRPSMLPTTPSSSHRQNAFLA
jgi:Na+/glutamate symporter